MAKAADVEGLDGGLDLATAARRIAGVRAQEVFADVEGVLDTADIERVHAMRVATRRLRAVLEIFGAAFDPAELRPILRDVKRLADALGERRDPDVQIAHFSGLRDALPEADAPGVDLVVERLKVAQDNGNDALALALDDVRASDLEGRLEALTREPEPDA